MRESLSKGLSIRPPSPSSEPSLLRLQSFHVLSETPCPYLPNRYERKLFTEILGPRAGSLYSDLSRVGFRRSHMFAYRPACRGCNACVPVRVDVVGFAPGKSLRRISRRNADLVIRERPPVATQEQYRVFCQYIQARHGEGEMASMTFADYCSMIEETHLESRLFEFRFEDDMLAAVVLADWLDDGLSAVYSFFDPAFANRSLGNYMILALVEHARRAGLSYVYLGYWIAGSPKMSYKSRFRPLQALTPHGWRPFEAVEQT